MTFRCERYLLASIWRSREDQVKGKMMLRSIMLALLFGTLWLPILAEAKSKAPPVAERNPKRVGTSTTKPSHPSEVEASPWHESVALQSAINKFCYLCFTYVSSIVQRTH
jgi:hypothetical protein